MIKKTLLLLLVCTLLSAMLLPSFAEEAPVTRTSGPWTYSLLPDGTAKIISYRSRGRTVTMAIPRSLDGIPVTDISNQTFRNVNGLLNVILPEGLTATVGNAFNREIYIEAVTLPETLTLQRYEAQNGVIVNYYLYIPETEGTSEKQPILIYFHGTRDTLEKHHGIGELIRTDQTKPKGIVILPQAVNETDGYDFHNGRYQDAVLELTGDIADKHNGNIKRLSVSGHSDGGVTAYQIVNGHPGVFAACAPISAVGNIGKGIMQTNLWVFQGEKDFWVKPATGLRVVLKCEKAGCNAMHYIYKDEGHDIQTMVFQDTFIDENNKEVRLIDWLMSKELIE